MAESVATQDWGRVGHLTADQQNALRIFGDKCPIDELNAAKYACESIEQGSLRFLRARKFDVQLAIDLVLECNKTLKKYGASQCVEMGAENTCNCDPDVLTSFYPHCQKGYDRQGRLILWEANGCVNIDALQCVVRAEGLIKYHLWTMQSKLLDDFTVAPEDSEGRKVVETLAILDFDGLSMHHFSSKMFSHLKHMIAIDNVCFPEMLGKMVVVNAPSIATTGWRMIKGWLDERTQDKIEILGSGEEQKARLLELIPEQVLPKSMGGLASEVFAIKPATEYVAVPRGGSLVRWQKLGENESLRVDTYVRDSMVGCTITVYSDSSSSPGSDDCLEVRSKGELQERVLSIDSFICETDKEGEAGRKVHEVPKSDSASKRVVKIEYKNTSSWCQRLIVISLTVLDEDGLPYYFTTGKIAGKLVLSEESASASATVSASACEGDGDVPPIPTV